MCPFFTFNGLPMLCLHQCHLPFSVPKYKAKKKKNLKSSLKKRLLFLWVIITSLLPTKKSHCTYCLHSRMEGNYIELRRASVVQWLNLEARGSTLWITGVKMQIRVILIKTYSRNFLDEICLFALRLHWVMGGKIWGAQTCLVFRWSRLLFQCLFLLTLTSTLPSQARKTAQLGKLIPGDLAQTGFLSAHKLSANRFCTCKPVCYSKLFTITVCKPVLNAGKQVNNSWWQEFNNLLPRLCAGCPQLWASLCALWLRGFACT